MKKLQGKHAYQNYNAHYIPVTSTDPKEPDNMVYHPCHQTEQPAWDEYVVFEKNQALPRFVVELGVDLPTPVSPSIGNSSEKTVGIFIVKLEQLLEHPSLKGDQELVELVTKKLDSLLDLDSESPIPAGELGFYNRIIRLIDPKGKVNPTYLNLIKQPRESAATVSSKPSVKEEPPSLAKVVKKQEPASPSPSAGSGGMNQKTGYAYPSVSALASSSAASSATGAIQAVSKPPIPPKPVQKPTIAFGAEQWKKYFGDVGQEPPLPANIHEILNSPCPFIQGKKKEETHLLVLIPATLNGQPLTLKRLGALMKARDSKLKEGGYRYFNDNGNHIDTPFETSHWVLMTKDVIEGSRSKELC